METTPNGMTTLTGVMEVLKERGIDHELRLMKDGRLEDQDSRRIFSAEGMKIIRTYRFEGESNPSDSAVLYLLENADGFIGYIINAYGAYDDYEGDLFDNLIRNLPVDEREF
ncbi:hypothetical protein ACFOTA_23695 [Chitinophaga sp. GCM10012297]|uniref:Phosphoribosylpyrophosphate synthetase n=1 Tax=Chitinophaga chungangae TaxID=2821488 RepID=A0ABS3YKK9_9BACT|nr:hypothetical protein [Chitinophaga chungangae]MBO9155234.1 hypothetical protein [Chitinophaga chungangae]